MINHKTVFACVGVCLATLIVCFGLSFYPPQPAYAAPVAKWEYTYVNAPNLSIPSTSSLNTYGKEGWELVQLVNGDQSALMKRRLP